MANVQIWNRCNNKCIMCTNPLWFSKEPGSLYSFPRIVSQIRRLAASASKEGYQISGGEPTLNPHLIEIMSHIFKEAPSERLCLLSNGRMFAYEDFTERVLAFRNIKLEISVLGHTARLHDRITGVRGSFKQTLSGIKNILKRKREDQALELRVIMVKPNYKYLDAIVGFINKNFKTIDTLVIIFPEPEGRCRVDFKNVGLTYPLVRKYVLKVVKKWKGVYRDLRLYHFPLCSIDHAAWPSIWVTQDPGETTFIKKCRGCRFKRYCSGIHKGYLKIVGSGEFKAPEKDRSINVNRRIKNPHHPVTEVS